MFNGKSTGECIEVTARLPTVTTMGSLVDGLSLLSGRSINVG